MVYAHLKQFTGTVIDTVTKQREEVFAGIPNQGGSGRLVTNPGDRSWYTMLSANKSALVSVFSELLPVAASYIYEADVNYRGHRTARIAAEAWSEAVSFELATELADELGIPNGRNIIEGRYQEFLASSVGMKDSHYNSVPQARTWTKKHSIQAATDLYMTRPEAFMAAITAK